LCIPRPWFAGIAPDSGYDNPTITPLYDFRCAPHRSR
jgi:hypothetical protein